MSRGILYVLWGHLSKEHDCVRELNYSYPRAKKTGLPIRVAVGNKCVFDYTWIKGLTAEEIYYYPSTKYQWANRFSAFVNCPFDETLAIDTDSIIVQDGDFKLHPTIWPAQPGPRRMESLLWPFEAMQRANLNLAGVLVEAFPEMLRYFHHKKNEAEKINKHRPQWASLCEQYQLPIHYGITGAVIYYTKPMYPTFELAKTICDQHNCDDIDGLAVAMELSKVPYLPILRQFYLSSMNIIEGDGYIHPGAIIVHCPGFIRKLKGVE